MDCLIISGMSGAGKSVAVDVLEDIGYYCIDNMPVRLIPQFAELFSTSAEKKNKVAFVVDVRGGQSIPFCFPWWTSCGGQGIPAVSCFWIAATRS